MTNPTPRKRTIGSTLKKFAVAVATEAAPKLASLALSALTKLLKSKG